MSDRLNVGVILETTRLAFAGQMPFPQVIGELMRIGVTRYAADLLRLEKVYYDAAGATALVPLPLENVPAFGAWSADGVAAAVRQAQQGKVIYPEFLRLIVAAGCTWYWVFIDGRQVIYCSGLGDTHV